MPRVTARGSRGISSITARISRNTVTRTIKGYPRGNTINYSNKLTPRVSQTSVLRDAAKFYSCYSADEQYVDWIGEIGYFPVKDESLTAKQGLDSFFRPKRDRENLLVRSIPFSLSDSDAVKEERTLHDPRNKGTRKVISVVETKSTFSPDTAKPELIRVGSYSEKS